MEVYWNETYTTIITSLNKDGNGRPAEPKPAVDIREPSATKLGLPPDASPNSSVINKVAWNGDLRVSHGVRTTPDVSVHMFFP